MIYWLAANFDTFHTARATCQGDPPNELNPTVIKVAWMDLSPCEDRMVIRSTVSEICLWKASARAGSGRAAHARIFFDKPQNNSLRSLTSFQSQFCHCKQKTKQTMYENAPFKLSYQCYILRKHVFYKIIWISFARPLQFLVPITCLFLG